MAQSHYGAIGGRMRPHLQLVPGLADLFGAGSGLLRGAACTAVDPELFFDGEPDAITAAKKVCGACPVRAACLQMALDNGECFGIFGGLTASERRALRPKGVRAA
ncbi:WhiB family transcriptional regulator [Streptomyces sp. 7N604]|uniref:WhiB family transcriptional regulator n=1 Tax=Streptomyces sp. 7N604 TaxID=3457415 RepID=UPI003FD2D68D